MKKVLFVFLVLVVFSQNTTVSAQSSFVRFFQGLVLTQKTKLVEEQRKNAVLTNEVQFLEKEAKIGSQLLDQKYDQVDDLKAIISNLQSSVMSKDSEIQMLQNPLLPPGYVKVWVKSSQTSVIISGVPFLKSYKDGDRIIIMQKRRVEPCINGGKEEYVDVEPFVLSDRIFSEDTVVVSCNGRNITEYWVAFIIK